MYCSLRNSVVSFHVIAASRSLHPTCADLDEATAAHTAASTAAIIRSRRSRSHSYSQHVAYAPSHSVRFRYSLFYGFMVCHHHPHQYPTVCDLIFPWHLFRCAILRLTEVSILSTSIHTHTNPSVHIPSHPLHQSLPVGFSSCEK